MPEFSSIKLEVYLAGAWVDIWTDVKHNPRPTWNRGVMNNGILDRTGEVETLTFHLDNSAANSGGLAGYYTPGHTNCRSGWRTGIQVRLSFEYDGRSLPYYKYYGTITPEGISVTPGNYAERDVEVTCIGWMGQASEHDIDLISIAENKTIEQAVALLLANMTVQPLTTDYGTGQSTFPSVFDTVTTKTKAIAELDKLAVSELGWIYTTGNRTNGETLVVKGRDDLASQSNTNLPLDSLSYELLETGDYAIMETGDKVLLDLTETAAFDNDMMKGAETAYGKHFINRVKTTAYPRDVGGSNEVLWTLQNAIEIPANSTKTGIRGTYRDPTGGSKTVKGKDMVTPASGTDFVANSQEDGGGSSQTANMSVTATFGAADVEFSAITNSSGASIWTGGDAGTFQVRGKAIRFYDTVNNVVDDDNSQSTYNVVRELDVDMKYQDDPIVTNAFAEYALELLKTPRTTFERVPLLANRDSTNMNGFLHLEPGTRAHFTETMSGIDGDYFIMGYDAEIVDGKYVIWSPVLVSAEYMDFTLWENGYDRITEYFTSGTNLIFTEGGISSGNAAQYTGTITNHSGVWYIASHSSNANSGASFTHASGYTLSQGAVEFITYFSPTHANTNARMGFRYTTIIPSTDEIVLVIGSSLSLSGVTEAAAASSSTTGTSYTLTEDTWYQGRIKVNQAGTLVTFELYNEYGVLLWSDTISTNIPAVAVYPTIRSTYGGTPSGTTTLLYVDYCTAGWVHD